MEQILSSDNLNRAYLQVVRNKGAEGVDGMKYTELKEHLAKNGESIKEQLRTRKYRPQPVRRVEIPKPDGGVLPDDELIIEEQLSRAEKQSDVILISGGASVGDKDYTKQVLEKIGEVQHWKLAIKPGKPFAWGKINNTKVFVLPGNPVACWVTYLILVLPALKVLSGIQPNLVLPKKIQAKAQFNTHKAQSRLQFLRGNIAIVDSKYFGTTGTATYPFNLGRTATHEIGHWLNLRHIWGDANCGSDLVNDTPTHNTANYGVPAFPHYSTCSGSPIEMTMNYMDYSDDRGLYMFTEGQKVRMLSLFTAGGARAGFAK